jgi:hypothetical protein
VRQFLEFWYPAASIDIAREWPRKDPAIAKRMDEAERIGKRERGASRAKIESGEDQTM